MPSQDTEKRQQVVSKNKPVSQGKTVNRGKPVSQERPASQGYAPVQKNKGDIFRNREEQGPVDSRMKSPFNIGEGVAKSTGEGDSMFPRRVNFISY